MKNWATLISILLMPYLVFSQDGTLVPEYLHDYEVAATDSARCYALWQASYNSAQSDARRGLEYGKEAIEFARKTANKKLLADCHNALGFCWDSMGVQDSAMYHYAKSLEMLTLNGNSCEVASVYANIGGLRKKHNDIQGALDYFTRAEEIQKHCEDLGYHASTLYSIGACYNSMKNFPRALEYFTRAVVIEERNNNIGKLGHVHNGKANAYLGMDDLPNARKEYGTALYFYRKAGNVYNVAYSYEGLAQLCEKTGELDSAIYYCSSALHIFDSLNVNFDIVFESALLAGYMNMAGKSKEAESLLLQTIPLTFQENLPYDRQNIFSSLASIYAETGNYSSAYKYLEKAVHLRDSLNLDEQTTALREMAGKYETEKRDKQIAIEQAENQKQRNESEKQRQLKYVFMGGVFFLAVIALALVGRFKQKQRAAKELAEKNAQIEKEKERAERSEQIKQQFLANMSHEIRTPVNAINGLSRLLLDKAHDSQTTEYLKAITHSGENLRILLNDILDISKLEAGKVEIRTRAFDLREEIKNTIDIFRPRANSKDISLQASVDESVPGKVYGDPVRISQVLNNIVSNAIKFTDHGGVVLRARCEEPNMVCIEVEDTGIGIEEEKLDEIFGNFSQVYTGDTRKYEGTGLGLAIAKNLLKLMGGTIAVTSRVKKGTTFTIKIPLPESAMLEAATAVEKTNGITKEFHVIVAEDNDYNYLVTRDTLLKYFPLCKPYRAFNGLEVIELMENDYYDLVLMDVQMPEMDGYSATKELRRRAFEIPVIGLTASVIQSDLDKCLDAGMNAYIMKPFTESDFVGTIMSFFKEENLELHDGPSLFSDSYLEEMFAIHMPGKLLELKKAMNALDILKAKQIVHAIRPQLARSGLVEGELLSREIEELTTFSTEASGKVETLCNMIEERLQTLKLKLT